MNTLSFALHLLAELVPLFLLISMGVYLTLDVVRPDRIRRLLDRSPWIGIPLGAALGAVTPFCSCSTVPLIHGMRQAGVPLATTITFLLASPLVSPVAVALLWSALGGEYAVLYAVAATSAAVVGGLLVAALHRNDGAAFLPLVEPTRKAGGRPPRWDARVKAAWSKSVRDLRKLAVPLLVAVGIGSAIHGWVPTELLSRVLGADAPLAVPAAALLGLPVYASIAVLLPIGSALLLNGAGIGVVTAFLMGASGFSIPEGVLLSKVLSRRLLASVVVVFGLEVVAIGYVFQAVGG